MQLLNSQAAKMTPFQVKVLKLCCSIPKGKVSSYGAMAKELDSVPRAVGQAMRSNPFPPQVPCHRVVAQSRAIGGFAGHTELDSPEIRKKIQLLKDEGVRFDANGKVAPDCMLASFSAQ